MADLTKLLGLLEEYDRALARHRSVVSENFSDVKHRYGALSAVYDGEAASTFKAGWRHTDEVFDAYLRAVGNLEPLLASRIEALRAADQAGS